LIHPKLYHKDKNNRLWEWNVRSERNEVITEHGMVDGKKQEQRYVAQPTNVGKANERTPEQQADFEAEAKWKFQLERKYSLSPEDAEDLVFLPMLAHKFEAKKKHLFKDKTMTKFLGCDMQPKLDGVRCMALKEDGKVVLLSRQGKEWKFVPHINDQLEWLPDGDCLDGELYIHDEEMSFQVITSWCKGKDKKPHPESHRIEYHVYDYPMVANDPNWAIWKNRGKKLAEIPESQNVKIVPTFACEKFEDIAKFHAQFVEEGYEGGIIRLRDGEYSFGQRSDALLKVKSFCDDEYIVVGWTTGKEGSREGNCVIWVCKDNNSDATFQVRPQGTHSDREELTKIADQFVGQRLKVKYFELTDDGIPRFPVGQGFRAEED